MKRSQAFPSKYLSKEDVEKPRVGTIRSTSTATFEGDNGDETKPILHFDEDDIKPMLLNFGNWTTCEELFGEDSDSWVGKKIEIYKDPNVMYGKKKVGGLRLRAPESGAAAAPAPKPTAEMWDRYTGLWQKATALKLTADLEAAPADISAAGLAEKGRALRQLIEQAEF